MAIVAMCLGIFTAKWLTSPLLNADKTESIPMDEIVEDKVFALIFDSLCLQRLCSGANN
jgi:hypothetical protein